MTLGERIKCEREKRNLSQHELAEMVGCSCATVCVLEKARRRPSAWLLKSIADAFDMTMEQLQGNAPEDDRAVFHGLTGAVVSALAE